MPFCLDYKQVYEYYLKIATDYSNKNWKILKTDTHNESGIWGDISKPLAPILAQGNQLTCFEIDAKVLNLAKKNFPDLDLQQGDIRKLDESKHYDLLLDFSTIDHVEPNEFPSILRSYSKIADKISIIVWLSDTRLKTGNQNFFKNWDFRKAFYNHIGEFDEKLLYAEIGATLVHFRSKSCLGNI